MADDIYDALSTTREFHAAATNQVYISGPRHRAPENFGTRNGVSGLEVLIDESWMPIGGVRSVEFEPVRETRNLQEFFLQYGAPAGRSDGPGASFWRAAYQDLLQDKARLAQRMMHVALHGDYRMTAFGVEVCMVCGVQR